MKDFGTIVLAIFGGVVTLAIISVIISRNSQAPQVIQASASALGNIIGAAVNPLPARPSGATIPHAQSIPWTGLGNSAWNGFLGGS